MLVNAYNTFLKDNVPKSGVKTIDKKGHPVLPYG
jgi:hypothetical protein